MSETTWFSYLPAEMIKRLKHLNSDTPLINKEEFLEEVRFLDLSGLNLAKVPDFIKHTKNLRYLDLSDNFIGKELDGAAFPDSLLSLNLNNNELTKIDFSSMSMELQAGLQYVYLEQNKIEEFPSGIPAMVSLVDIKLNHNLIELLPNVRFPLRLNSVELTHNRLIKIEIVGENLSNCMRLLMDHNLLEDIPETIFTAKILRVLGIKNNNIAEWRFMNLRAAHFVQIRV